MRRVLLLLLAACGDDPDPCATVETACIALRVESDSVDEIDQLELDILYGERHDTLTTALADNGVVALPLVTALALELDATTHVGVVAAGRLGGNVLGFGAAAIELAADQRVALDLVLAPRSTCEDGGDYCGGDELAGEKDTLYRCRDGFSIARGRCVHGCTVRDSIDDACEGGPMTCEEGGFYCGGNEVAGDPGSRYRCVGGQGVDREMCANGCQISPAGFDDVCR
jgi:hypothetical protein